MSEWLDKQAVKPPLVSGHVFGQRAKRLRIDNGIRTEDLAEINEMSPEEWVAAEEGQREWNSGMMWIVERLFGIDATQWMYDASWEAVSNRSAADIQKTLTVLKEGNLGEMYMAWCGRKAAGSALN